MKQVRKYHESKDIDAKSVLHASMDMSPSFISGVHENFPNAEILIDSMLLSF